MTGRKSLVCLGVAVAAVCAGPLAQSQSWAKKAVVGSLHGTSAASGDFRANVTSAPGGFSGKLMVRARNLTPNHTYTLSAGGTALGTLNANRRGRGSAKFSTRPRGRTQALSTDPRGKVLTVTDPDSGDPSGDDVLEGEIGDPTTPGAIACCLSSADDEGCADLLPDECTTAGGTAAAAATCDPDPCPGEGDPPPAPGSIPCCLNTADEKGCTELQPADCTAAGGVAATAATCEPDPCPGESDDGVEGETSD